MFEAAHLAFNSQCQVCILSDANTFFIDTILEHHKMQHLFSAIVTNPAQFTEQGRLEVRPHQPLETPHNCPRCPPNMCKGKLLQEVLRKPHHERVIYIGDGGGMCAQA
eukprot:c15704_g1_i3.p2 GENE.c15704_g1_i3~~c15704_g1_i3.p2  ORF type:complete len:108 (+),score=21.48 c15704_g1_i3:1113-1436(+)